MLAPTGLDVGQFDVTPIAKGAVVNWQTANEANILGFNVLRGSAGATQSKILNPELILAEYAGTNSGQAYRYLDRDASGRDLTYTLQIVMLDGRTKQIGPVHHAP